MVVMSVRLFTVIEKIEFMINPYGDCVNVVAIIIDLCIYISLIVKIETIMCQTG